MSWNFPEYVMRVANAVRDEGGNALIVGGGIRDMVLGLLPKDVDIEVFGIAPDRLEILLHSIGGPVWVDIAGRSFGVFKVQFSDGSVIDVSIPRRESKSGSGHRGFEVSGDPFMPFEEAARRRDFTVNAMAFDPISQEFFDFFKGQEDLEGRILRATDTVKFQEDPLRVLRAMQFAGRFGMMVEPRTLTVCRGMVREREFAELPNARIGEEWRKLLLKSPRPSIGLTVGLATGAFHTLHPELVALIGCKQEKEWHPEGDVWTHTMMVVDVAAEIIRRECLAGDDALVIMLGALCHDLGKPAVTRFMQNNTGEWRWRAHGHEDAGIEPTRSFLSRMDFGKDVELRVVKLVADHLAPSHMFETQWREPTDSAIRKLARRLEPVTMKELVLVAEADHRGRTFSEDGFRAGRMLLERAQALKVTKKGPERILMGRHLIEHFGWKEGPHFKPVLDTVFEAQMEGRVTTFEEALAMAEGITGEKRKS